MRYNMFNTAVFLIVLFFNKLFETKRENDASFDNGDQI